MKPDKLQRFMRAVGEIDEGVLARYETVETGLTADRNRRARRLRFLAIAVAAALLLAAIPVGFLIARWGDETSPVGETGDTTPGDTIPGDTTPDETLPLLSVLSPDAAVSGAPLYIVGSANVGSSGIMEEPPAFEFCYWNLVVQAKAVECLPDTYSYLGSSQKYRLILFETQEVIHGEEMPSHFLYWLPARLYDDMTAYDCVLLAMGHESEGDFVVYNRTQGKAESFDMRVFGDYQDTPEMGNFIAFTDGVFDETLWQNDGWRSGYGHAEDDLENDTGYLVVRRGGTLEETKAKIGEKIREWKEHLGDRYSVPVLYKPTFDSPEAQAVLEYVKPFENGVFAETLLNSEHLFTRYIGGYATNEWYGVHSKTGQVWESGVRFTAEDQVMDLSVPINELASAYAEETPLAPHMTVTEEMNLRSLNIHGCYIKTDVGVYALIKTNWLYTSGEGTGMVLGYRDQALTVFEPGSSVGRSVTREELIDMLGDSLNLSRIGVYTGEYGEPQDLGEY